MPDRSAAPIDEPITFPTISGKWVVIAMFAMGILAGTINVTYWYLHAGPFRPLIETIGREFPKSLPKVEGGRHKKGPNTLRISVRVPFNPKSDGDRAIPVVRRLVELARAKHSLESFEVLEIHLIHISDLKQGTHREWKLDPHTLPVEMSTWPTEESQKSKDAPADEL